MNRRSMVVRGLLFGAFLAFAATTHGQSPRKVSTEELDRWIRELDDANFRVRSNASTRLRGAGVAAVPELARAARYGSAEASSRAMRILADMLESEDPTLEAIVRKSLTRLAEVNGAIGGEASGLLARRKVQYALTIERLGGTWRLEGDKYAYLDLDDAKSLPTILPLLPEFPDLDTLSISSKEFTDEVSEPLSRLKNLDSINLFESQIGNATVKRLATLPNLRRLPMGRTLITDEALKDVGTMKKLEYVGFRGTAVTDDGLKHLSELSELRGLNLTETKITDLGLKNLAPLKLEYIYLAGTPITDSGLETLATFKTLKRVYLGNNRTSREGVNRLRENGTAVIGDGESDP